MPDDELPPGGTPLDDPVWDPWPPGHVAMLLAGVTVPWYVAGGWAVDLFRGVQTREHEVLEIAIPGTAEAFGQVRAALAGYLMEVPGGPPQAGYGRWTARPSRSCIRPRQGDQSGVLELVAGEAEPWSAAVLCGQVATWGLWPGELAGPDS